MNQDRTAQPHIPAELWSVILRVATYEQANLDTSVLPPLSDEPRPWLVPFSTRQYIGGQVSATLNLCLVSKLWFHLALEFLYEYLYISSLSSYQAVMTLLVKPKSSVTRFNLLSPDHSPPICWYVKGIALQIVDPRLKEISVESIHTLLRGCPNLKVLQTFQSYVPAFETISFSAICEKAETLRYCRIFWDRSIPQSDGHSLLLRFQDYGILETLHLIVQSDSAFPASQIVLPKLHTLLVESFETDESHNIFQSLHL
jgi:hypothetical protein